MSDREDRPPWREDARSSASSGQRPASESSGGAAFFDTLDAPLPSELERSRTRTEIDRGDREAGRSTSAETREAPLGRQPERRRRMAPRRVKRKIKHVDPMSVLKVSLLMYSVFLVIWLVMVALFYNFLTSLGLFDSLENLGNALVLWDEVDISLGLVERWAFVIGLLFVVVGAIINVFLAFLYNLISDLVGGIELTFVERDQ